MKEIPANRLHPPFSAELKRLIGQFPGTPTERKIQDLLAAAKTLQAGGPSAG